MAGQLLDLHYFYDCQRATLLTRTADTLSIVTDRVVSVSGAFQTWPDGGFDGANCWAVWKRGSLGGQAGDDICAARFSPAGVVLDSPAIAVCATNQRQDYPAVACNTGRILAVWADARAGADQIWGQFLRPGGSLAGTNFPLGNAGTTFGAVASDGTNFLVAWEESGGSIGSRFVRANGTLSAVQTYGGDGDNPKVAFGSNVYLVVWEDGNNSIRARRYRSDETLLDALITIESGDSLYEPAIAYNPATNRFLVVWEDYPEVMGRIVDPGSGAVSSTLILVPPEEGLKVDPRVLYDGQPFVVTWAASTAANNYYAARVAGDGTLLDTNAMRILSRNSRILGAAASGAAGGPAWWLAHGIFYDNGANVYNAYRVFALPWQPGPQTNITPLVLTADQLPGNLARVQFTEPVPVCTNYVVETAVRVAGGWTAVSNGAIMVPNGVIGGIVCTNIPGGSAFYRVRGAR